MSGITPQDVFDEIEKGMASDPSLFQRLVVYSISLSMVSLGLLILKPEVEVLKLEHHPPKQTAPLLLTILTL